MDIKSLWQKLDQIAESSDVKSTSEGNAFGNAIRKAKSDGIQPGEKVTVGGKEYPVKEQDMAEDVERPQHLEHDKGYKDAARGINKNPYNPGSPSAKAYDSGQQAYKRHFGESLSEGSMKNYLHKEAEQCESAEEFSQRFGEYFSNEQDAREFWNACCGELDENAPELKNVKHFAKPGGYGRKIDKEDPSGDKFHSSDIDDTDDEVKSTSVKRGRGRPMKGGDSETGITKKYDTDTLASWIIGNKPKNIEKIGKVSHVNRLKEYMEMVERKTIVESLVAEGSGNKLEEIVDDIIEGRLDIYDIISGKYTPTNKVEEFVQKALTQSYEETARDHNLELDDDGDEIIGIMYNDIHDIMGKAYSKGIDEQAQMPGMPGTAVAAPAVAGATVAPTTSTATTSSTAPVKPLPVMAQGKQVGSAPTPQAVQAATPMVTDILNKKQALGKMGVTVTGLEESLSDTMNRFSSILNESSRRLLSESTTPKLVMEGTLEEIIAVHPHEHKMCQEGWGMDESLYEALCDHYYKEGRIPRKTWHGSAEDLRKCVEECYMKDTQSSVDEDISADLGLEPGSFSQMNQKTQDDILTMPSPIKVDSTPTAPTTPTTTPTTTSTPSESDEQDIRRHAMSNLVDELDESHDDSGLEAAHKKAKQISAEHGVVQHIERDPETGHHRVSDWYDSDTTVATYNNGKLREDMSEAKKPSAGMSAGAKSALVKKAKAGKDIGKPGKGFEKLAKKAGEKYGSAEKGKKVAAAAMWKNAAPTNEAISQDEFDQAALAHGKRGRAARDNPMTSVALNKKSQSSRDAAKELAKLRDTQRDLDEGQINEGKFGQMDADLADLSPAEFKKEYGMTKAEARAKHDGKKPEAKKLEEMDNPDRYDDAGKKQISVKPITVKKAVKSAEKELNKAFDKSYKSSKKDKIKESVEFSSWDSQLSSLLKPTVKQSVSESTQIQKKKQMINESSNELSTMLQFAGLKNVQSVMEEFNSSIYSTEGESSDPTEGSDTPPQLPMPTGMGMSQQSEEVGDSSVMEPMMSDEVIGQLSSGDKESAQSDNDHLSFFKKMLSHGQSEVKAETPKSESGEQSGIPASTSQSPVSGNTSEKPVTEKKDETESVSEGRYSDEESDSMKLASDIEDYAKKHGGIDKSDMMHVASLLKSGDVADAVKYVKTLDTDPKEWLMSKMGTMQEVDESEVEEGNAFTGALAKAKADGIQPGETMKVDGKTYPVKEESVVAGNGDNEEEQSEVGSDAQRDAGLAIGDANFFSSENSSTMAECDDEMNQGSASDPVIGDLLSKLAQLISGGQSDAVVDVQQLDQDNQDYADEEDNMSQCESCGGSMNEGHQCMESLNEWANSPTGESADEQFKTDMDFMTKVISGGLNNQKQDQTTLPSTRVVTKDESKEVDNTMGAMLRKLSGIN